MSGTATDTIFALSSAPGRAGVAVVRVSGPAAGSALLALTGSDSLPAVRLATLVSLRHPNDGTPIDRGLVLWFPAPESFTGEDVAEFHVHGGRAVVAALLDALGSLPGCALAEPGAFSRRAFHAGKLDLAAVEGLADLIDAETEAQRRQALRQMGGVLGRRTEELRSRLLRALALLESDIDFDDEGDVPDGLPDAVLSDIVALEESVAALLADASRGERLREGVEVAIVGAPNAGKSSLLNALAQRDVAIVSEVAGTTRDVLEVHLDLGGLPVVLADTAGLRDLGRCGPETDGQTEIEAQGIQRALARAERADIRIAIFDASTRDGLDPDTQRLCDETTLVVANKADLLEASARAGGEDPDAPILVSALTGEGLESLLATLTGQVESVLGSGGLGDAMVTRARHREALEDCRAALVRARNGENVELLAEDLRLAGRALARIVGRLDVEDILDVIFQEFCIGK